MPDCDRANANVNRINITHDQICVGRRFNTICAGDMMAPDSSRKWNLIGITSLSLGCEGRFKLPGIYTRVSEFLAWIRTITNEGDRA